MLNQQATINVLNYFKCCHFCIISMQQASQQTFQRLICVSYPSHTSGRFFEELILYQFLKVSGKSQWVTVDKCITYATIYTNSTISFYINWYNSKWILSYFPCKQNKPIAYWNAINFWLRRLIHSVPLPFLLEDYIIVGDLIQMHCTMFVMPQTQSNRKAVLLGKLSNKLAQWSTNEQPI